MKEEQAEEIVVRTRHGELTLEQIAEMQPGLQRLMVEISERFWILYYAAKAGNWALARHELSGTRKALEMGQLTRPKYVEQINDYIRESLAPIAKAIQDQDWPAFEKAYEQAVDQANHYHIINNYEYILWQLPQEPPTHLKLRLE
ncbi:MAG TPA: hypothetical protein VNL15_00760 [Dehalococcoidia bacterium]|nr:hypothetical protein [Dehalococcoidia bacterium]